jgi:hypothetical protein
LEQRDFKPGFRVSAIDVAVLIVGACATAYVATYAPWIGIAIGFVVAHFFLFCNVVRMARRLELTWAAIFVALAAGGSARGRAGLAGGAWSVGGGHIGPGRIDDAQAVVSRRLLAADQSRSARMVGGAIAGLTADGGLRCVLMASRP